MQPKNQTEHKEEHNGESENLAERLRELYKIYECEQELPAHDDLAAKLDNVKPGVRKAIQVCLDQKVMCPVDSYEKAEKIINQGDSDNRKLKTFVREEIVSKFPDDQKKAVEEYFRLTREKKQPKDERINRFMEFSQNFAGEYFEIFKEEVKHYLTKT